MPKSLRKPLAIIILFAGLVLGIKNIHSLSLKNVKVQTARGIVYARPNIGNPINDVIAFLDKNTDTDEKVLVYPECLTINVMSNRKTDNKFYSLIPLYVETFGDDLITRRLELTKPEYVILNNYNTSIYYYSFFGKDYASQTYQYIQKNYKKVTQVGKKLKFTVYKRNDM